MKRSATPLALLICLLLVGCDKSPAFQQATVQADWQRAITTHSCTTAQMSKVQAEAKWCSDNTQYFSTYCYGSAILRNCTEKKS